VLVVAVAVAAAAVAAAKDKTTVKRAMYFVSALVKLIRRQWNRVN
jgi:hypothetical protein